MENIEKRSNIYLLNLPESTLDCILKRLSPMDLLQMSEVCTYLRDICRSDHLWEYHIKKKWGRIIGDVAYKEWQWHITSSKEKTNFLFNHQHLNQNGSLGSFIGTWPMLCLGSYLEDRNLLNGSLSNCFMMSLCFSLENGMFWFPAQLYMGLNVSDVLLSYNCEIDTFQARQRCGGWKVMGSNIQWDNLRSPSVVETPPYVRHISDCSRDLKPGDFIEMQWKLKTEAPYDWWYAIVCHLDSCNQNENYCRCHNSETLIIEFRQIPLGSIMRRIKLFRNNGELAHYNFGVYGGIRKLHTEEIKRWKKLLPPTCFIV